MMPGSRQSRALLLLLLLLLLLACQPGARAGGILIVASSGADLYDRFIDRFTADLAVAAPANGGSDISIIHLDSRPLTEDDLAARRIVVTVGSHAAREVVAQRPAVPLLHAIIPESVYRTLASPDANCARQSAIFIDQPLMRQADLAKAMFPAAVDYGILLGPTSSQREAEIAVLQASTDSNVVIRQAGHEQNIALAVNGLLQQVDLLIAVNDPLVLNRENAKWLLYSAYQRGLPVIGFSRAYVDAGAAGAVFSEPGQMARQAAGIVQRHLAGPGGCLPVAGFPRYFSVAVNQSVCSSLGGANCDADILWARLADKEPGS